MPLDVFHVNCAPHARYLENIFRVIEQIWVFAQQLFVAFEVNSINLFKHRQTIRVVLRRRSPLTNEFFKIKSSTLMTHSFNISQSLDFISEKEGRHVEVVVLSSHQVKKLVREVNDCSLKKKRVMIPLVDSTGKCQFSTRCPNCYWDTDNCFVCNTSQFPFELMQEDKEAFSILHAYIWTLIGMGCIVLVKKIGISYQRSKIMMSSFDYIQNIYHQQIHV